MERLARSGELQHAAVLEPSSSHEIAAPETNDQSEREKLIRRRWSETGIKMWNPDFHGAGYAVLNIQGRSELLPPKPGKTLPRYDTHEFKVARSNVNGASRGPCRLRRCCCRSAKAASRAFDSRGSYDNNWNLMLFRRMYPARLGASDRSGALLFVAGTMWSCLCRGTARLLSRSNCPRAKG